MAELTAKTAHELTELVRDLRELGAYEVQYEGFVVKFPQNSVPTKAVTLERTTVDEDVTPKGRPSMDDLRQKLVGSLGFPGADK
jgi:hypothetical protein